jgi:ATP-binding cassette subfamily B protein
MASRASAHLILRLVRLARDYRWGCLRLVLLQMAILGLTLTGLSLVGLSVDTIQAAAQGADLRHDRLFGLSLPEGWTALDTTIALAGCVVLVAILRAVAGYAYTVASARFLQRQIVVEIRRQVFAKLQRLPHRFYATSATGSLIARVTSDVQSVRLFVDGVLLQLAILVLSLAIFLTYMFSINATLTLLCLATTPALWILSARFSRAVRPAYVRNRQLADHLLLVLSENVLGVQVVKALSRQAAEIARFRRANAAVRDQKWLIFRRVSRYSPSVEILLSVNQWVLLGYGGYLAIDGRLPLGTGLLVFSGLLQQFSGQITKMTNIINSVQESLAGAQRVFEVLDAPVEVESSPTARPLDRFSGPIELDRVSFAYQPGQPVLRDVSLRIEPGECVAIFGATGAGKTTLLRLIARFYDVTSGRVLVEGLDVRDVALGDLRRQMAMVFQEPFLFSESVRANIAMARPEATDAEVRAAGRMAAADEFISCLPQGYDTILREGGKDLSGGQRQRLTLARAFAAGANVLLLDDPTSAVDAATEDQILCAMQEGRTRPTIVLVTHRLRTAALADRIVVLDRGRIVEEGPHDELLARRGRYWEAVEHQEHGSPTVFPVAA